MSDQAIGLLAELAIEKQIKRFYGALDARAFDAMADVMTETGCWRRGGVNLTGRAVLLAAMAERPADRHSAHIITNVLAEVGDGTATATFLCTAFVHLGPTGERGACPMEVPSSIGACTAKFALVDGVWRLEHLGSKPKFKRAA